MPKVFSVGNAEMICQAILDAGYVKEFPVAALRKAVARGLGVPNPGTVGLMIRGMHDMGYIEIVRPGVFTVVWRPADWKAAKK